MQKWVREFCHFPWVILSFKVRMQNDVWQKLHTQREFQETIT